MARYPKDYVPKLRLHKRSGAAVCTLQYRDFQLGKYGTPEAQAAYHALIARWLAGGRQPLDPIAAKKVEAAPFTIDRLCDQFEAHARAYYLHPDGRPTSEAKSIRYALLPLRELFGSSLAREFGPLKLKQVREQMIGRGWVRSRINREIQRLHLAFRWAASEELIPSSVAVGLRTVSALKKGRTQAAESSPVRPVEREVVEQIKPYCPGPVRALIDLQLLTAARPGELLNLRACDIDRSAGAVWVCVLTRHKTAHHGHGRTLFFGPRAQAVLQPFIDSRAADVPLFSPREANAEAKAAAATKKQPRRPGQKKNPTRTGRRIGEAYDISSYRRAITRACDHADAAERRRREEAGETVPADVRLVARFHPHQLRHTASTELRRRFGLQAAQVILGHSTLTATQVYAEADVANATRIAGEVG